MRKILVFINVVLLILIFFTVVVVPTYGQGKKAQAPGQAKKEEKAVVGNVDQVKGNSLVVEEKKGNKKTETTVDGTTQVIGDNKKRLNLKQIKPKDFVAIISTESGTATGASKPKKAVKIFVQEASVSAQSKRRAIQGVISNINGNVLTLVHQVHHDRIFTLLVTDQTLVKMKGAESSSSANLQVGMRIVAVGDLNEQGMLVARRIHVIPGLAKGLPKLPLATPSGTLGTPSATPIASPSATPTATPSATPTP